jgi:hypothetical protein
MTDRCELLSPVEEIVLNDESEAAEWFPLVRVAEYLREDDHNLHAIRAAQAK